MGAAVTSGIWEEQEGDDDWEPHNTFRNVHSFSTPMPCRQHFEMKISNGFTLPSATRAAQGKGHQSGSLHTEQTQARETAPRGSASNKGGMQQRET